MKVISKQANSKKCIICGINNPNGVKANFYNMEDGSAGVVFKFLEDHQSYPGRVHGGMISAMLDELAGRVLWVNEPEKLGVTAKMTVNFRKPVLYNKQLVGIGYYVEQKSRKFIARSKIFDGDELLAEAECIYVILPKNYVELGEKIDDDEFILLEDDVKEINFPNFER